MAYTFLKAQGQAVGKSLVEEDKLDSRQRSLQQAKARKVKFLLPIDHVVADRIDPSAMTKNRRPGQPIPDNMMAPRHRPEDHRGLLGRDRPSPNHHLERPHGRLRNAAVRQGH